MIIDPANATFSAKPQSFRTAATERVHAMPAGTPFAIGLPPEANEWGPDMWKFFNCYVSGRHDFGMWCEPGAIFLRCVHCGKRSPGWTVTAKATPAPAVHPAVAPVAKTTRVIPFGRAVVR